MHLNIVLPCWVPWNAPGIVSPIHTCLISTHLLHVHVFYIPTQPLCAHVFHLYIHVFYIHIFQVSYTSIKPLCICVPSVNTCLLYTCLLHVHMCPTQSLCAHMSHLYTYVSYSTKTSLFIAAPYLYTWASFPLYTYYFHLATHSFYMCIYLLIFTRAFIQIHSS